MGDVEVGRVSECRHGLEESWCATCMGSARIPPVIEGPTIASRFRAKCPGCGDMVEEGEDITLADVGWVCGGCVRAVAS